WLSGISNKINKNIVFEATKSTGKAVIEAKEVFFRYEKNSEDVIKNLSLMLFEGEFLAILGGNGTGKTTALSLISGINKPQRGEILINGSCFSEIKNLYNGLLGVLPQEPKSLFTKKTVFDELMDMTDKKADEKSREDAAISVARLCRIENLLKSHPYDLSGGEQQRVALSMILLKRPQILVMDEPTKGMDTHFKKIFAKILQDLKAGGASILMVSHDIEFCAEFADRCAMFFDGSVTAVGTAREFFKNNFFYTTATSRMARDILPDAVLAKDIIFALGGECEEETEEETHIDYQPEIIEPKPKPTVNKRKIGKYTALIMAVIVPLTVLFGVYFLGDRKYYFISLLIVLETLIPFFAIFEKGKKGAREVVVVSVLCAIGVAGRIAFFMIPQLKPLLAVVILSGVSLGGEVGFLVGAMSGFLSNFFFGQGPWTPWQMFALGLIGFLAGVVFGKGILKKTRLSLALFGFFSALLIYGGIMNPASVLMVTTDVNWGMIYSAFLVGFPIDLVHAASTAVFLWFLGKPFIEKMERIKIKYGLL
ncbi:MAG: ATP-binding cassette domain-containing protein, partial [Clostridia bacterium]|nr:ATP-binding cassette domain-containing protein [Clostridia bacterium]